MESITAMLLHFIFGLQIKMELELFMLAEELIASIWGFDMEILPMVMEEAFPSRCFNKSLMDTYRIASYNHNYELFTHTPYVSCVKFIYEWRDLQFKVDPEWQTSTKLFHGNFI